MDGGVIDNIPIEVVPLRGADIVIVVDISEKNGGLRKHNVDVLITPDVSGVGMMDFTQKKCSMQAGIDVTRAAVPTIHEAMADWISRQSPAAIGTKK